MSRRERVRLVAALVLGAALAFPAGLFLAGREEAPSPPTRRSQAAAVRDVFSPRVRSDPYFLDRQRANVEALEAHCRETGDMCPEASGARQRLEELISR